MKPNPNIFELCKKAFAENEFVLYQMGTEVKLTRYYGFILLRYNKKTKNTHVIRVANIRNLINLCHKKGFTTHNPCGISKKHYTFQKGAILNEYYKGDRRTDLVDLKYTKKQ